MQKKIIANPSPITTPSCDLDNVFIIHRQLAKQPNLFRISCNFDSATWKILQTTAKTLKNLSTPTAKTLLTPPDERGGTIGALQLVELVTAMMLHSLSECVQSAIKTCLAKLGELVCSK